MEFKPTKEYVLQLNVRKICKKCSTKNSILSVKCRACKHNTLRLSKQKRSKTK